MGDHESKGNPVLKIVTNRIRNLNKRLKRIRDIEEKQETDSSGKISPNDKDSIEFAIKELEGISDAIKKHYDGVAAKEEVLAIKKQSDRAAAKEEGVAIKEQSDGAAAKEEGVITEVDAAVTKGSTGKSSLSPALKNVWLGKTSASLGPKDLLVEYDGSTETIVLSNEEDVGNKRRGESEEEGGRKKQKESVVSVKTSSRFVPTKREGRLS